MFTQVQLSYLRSEFAKLETIDPCSSHYERLVKMLDAMSLAQLQQVRDANIKFMSKLAINRITRRMN